MDKITIRASNPDEVVAYTITQTSSPEQVLFLGYGKLSTVVTLQDFRRSLAYNPEAVYTMTIIDREPDREVMDMYKAMYNPIECMAPKSSAVRCVETGEVFKTSYEAAKTLGLTFSALSNHLNGKKGFKTVKGLTFARV